MKYAVDNKEQYTVFRIEEENLNSSNAPTLKSELVLIFQKGVKMLRLDIRELNLKSSLAGTLNRLEKYEISSPISHCKLMQIKHTQEVIRNI